MSKKHSTTKKLQRNKSLLVLWVVVMLLLVAQIVSLWYIIKSHNDSSEISSQRIYTLVNESEQKRYKYPVIDISENRVYIPEAKIYLPLTDTTRELRYDYFSLKNHESLYFSVNSTVGQQTQDESPTCDKIVSLTKSENPHSATTDPPAATVPATKDGLTDVRVHADCKIYFGDVKTSLLEAVEQLKNY